MPVPSLVVRIDQLPAEGQTYSLRLSPEEVDAALSDRGVGGLQAEDGLSAEVRLLPSGSDLFCLGQYSARLNGVCARCLSPAGQEIRSEFHITYVRKPEACSGAEHELHREDLELEVLPGETLDLAEVVVEQFVLDLPTTLLCSAQCRGLCPSCGVNRNEEECACDGRAVDPRFAVLAALRKSGEQGSG